MVVPQVSADEWPKDQRRRASMAVSSIANSSAASHSQPLGAAMADGGGRGEWQRKKPKMRAAYLCSCFRSSPFRPDEVTEKVLS